MFPKNFIYTYKGKCFSPLEPHCSDIDIEDIAHALSLLCRANGHFSSFYSVAQHSIACAEEAEKRGYSKEVRLGCLLHDASEAYISDITRPVKLALEEYKEIEKRLQTVIFQAFGLYPNDEFKAQITSVDDAMLYYEFFHYTGQALFEKAPFVIKIPKFCFVDFTETEKRFLQLFSELNSLINSQRLILS